MNKRYIVIVCGVFIIALLGGMYLEKTRTKEKMEVFSYENEEKIFLLEEEHEEKSEHFVIKEQEKKEIVVYLCGSIAKEGVYNLSQGARVFEAVNLAGGLKEEASKKHINLARELVDGESIYFPTEEEGEEIAIIQGEEPIALQGPGNSLVNINTASLQELTSLPGIGEAKAKSIIQYRESNGAFKTIEDIKKVTGIKNALFSLIKDLICV